MLATIPTGLAERSEAEAAYDLITRAPVTARKALGMTACRVAGGVVISVRNDPMGQFSKSVGLGIDEPISAGLIAEVIDIHRAQGAPSATFHLPDVVLPQEWPEICARAGLRPGAPRMKLVRELDLPHEEPRLDASLRVEPVGATDAAAWTSVLFQTAGLPDGFFDTIAATVGRNSWHACGVWQNGAIVGTGTVHLHEDVGQLLGGTVKPIARGMGAHTALLIERARKAKDNGCRWLVAETEVERPGERNPSLHNMLRIGFHVQYERRSWIWRPTDD